MTFPKDSLNNTTLPVIVLENQVYPFEGQGGEGIVFRYNKQIAFKIFNPFDNYQRYKQKFQKIELLTNFRDEAFCFPIGLVGYDNYLKEGYYTNLVVSNPQLKDFTKLLYLKDKEKVLNYLIKADIAMQRIHQKGIVLGDIKGANIMINQNDNPVFVDTDNYAYGDYDFDIVDYKTRWLYQMYNRDFSGIDNDIYIFTIMALELLTSNPDIELIQSKAYLNFLIDNLNTSLDVKEGLKEIISDAPNKPYLGPILKRVKPNSYFLSPTVTYKMNRIFRG